VAVRIDLADGDCGHSLLRRLLAAVAQPVRFGDLSLQVSASVGLTVYPQGEEVDADQLLRQADHAMYQAKLAGKNRCHVLDAEQDRGEAGTVLALDRIAGARDARARRSGSRDGKAR
jgi:predicted signal transduction protein with EAL and GGDEF domain